LVAIPNRIVEDYQKVAKLAGLDLYAVEAETLGLTRVLVKEKGYVLLVDIGVQSTTISIVERQNLKESYSFDFAGSQLTYAISSALGLGHTETEELKMREGLASSKENISKTLYLLIDPLLSEVKKIMSDFYIREGKDIDMISLTGGTSALPGLREYFQEILGKRVDVPNCFSDVLYPPILGKSLETMAPSFSAAMGVALGGLETK
jgi:type IV pilus assembly protein PilM